MPARPDEDAFLLDVAKALYPRVHNVVPDPRAARDLAKGLGKAVAAAEAGQRVTGLSGLLSSHPTTRTLVGLTILRLDGKAEGETDELDRMLGAEADRFVQSVSAQGHRPLPATQAAFYVGLAGRKRPMPTFAEERLRASSHAAAPSVAAVGAAAVPTAKPAAKPRRFKCTECHHEVRLPPGKRRAPPCPFDGATLVPG